MRDLLLILNPRRIEECVASYRELAIDRLWLRNMDEFEIERRWLEILTLASEYDRLVLVSDDAVVRQPALDAVLGLLDEGHPVVTGYANLDESELRVNLNRIPLADQSFVDSYDFYTLGEVQCWPERAVPTTLTGFALTGMSWELWQRFPYRTELGADFSLSKRLAGAGIPIVAAREAFIWHVKERWNRLDSEPRKRLLVGELSPAIELEQRLGVAA